MVSHITCALLIWITTINKVYTGDCDPGFVKHGSSCYHFSHDTETWLEAMAMCVKLYDATLVEIETQDENQFIRNQSNALRADYWIGANDFQIKGEWRWYTTHVPLLLNTWCPGSPSHSVTYQNCVEMSNSCGNWHDDNCHKFQKYICEKQLESVQAVLG